AGHHAVHVTATANGLSTAGPLVFDVLNANAAPVFDPQPGWNVAEGQDLTFRTFAVDPDHPDFVLPTTPTPGVVSPVTYSIQGLPPGATYDPQTATFHWAPGYTQAGTYSITVTALADGDHTGTRLSTAITIPSRVRNVNRPPVIMPAGNLSANRGQTLDVTVHVTDPDGDPIALSAASAAPGFPLPRFATFTDLGNGTGTLH